MLRRKIALSSILSIAVLSAMLLSTLSAQESGTTEKIKRRGPLPFYFGKIGVDNDQRDKLYTIQESYEARLEALRLEMKKLLKERDEAMEATLTPGQKLRLDELKAETVKEAKNGQKPAVKAKPAEE